MLKDITIGQFFPGSSFLHKLDPRSKIISTILYIIIIFMCKSLASFAFITAFTLLMIVASRISAGTILKGLKPLIFVLLLTTIYNVFFYSGDDLLFSYRFIKVYREGVLYALLMAIRIICLLVGSSVILTYTTSPIMLTDGLEQLLSPFSKIGLPVHEFSMMMTIALRFIPTLIEETDKIMSAQKARGSDFGTGSVINRVKALVPIIIPLFISSFRRAIDLAMAMECRCYRGGNGRTKMTRLRFSFRDIISLAVLISSGAWVLFLNSNVNGFNI